MAFLQVRYFSDLSTLERGDAQLDPLNQLIKQEETGEYEWVHMNGSQGHQSASFSKQHVVACSKTSVAAQPRSHLVSKYQVTQELGGQPRKITVRVRRHGITAQ